MFSIELPLHAALTVKLPTGGEAAFIHVGGGRFLSNVPPLVLMGVSPEPREAVTGLPVIWDGITLPGTAPAHPFALAFDAVAAGAAVEQAAADGDEFAKQTLAKMDEAMKMLEAQRAVGMVKEQVNAG